MVEVAAGTSDSVRQRLAWGVLTSAGMALYYFTFFFPPRLAGSNDPDRYYHIAISQLMAAEGALLRVLPQVEDLAWGRYFPDKEFLFHALTGAAYSLDGAMGVLLVVPLLGIAIACVLYSSLCSFLAPWRAALLTLAVVLTSAAFVFRITLLRPHLLAILFFCLLLAALLRGRPRMAALAAAGFALSYHAVYIPLLAILCAGIVRWPAEIDKRHCAWWALAGLAVGTIVNPYFPSTLVMSGSIIKLALGVGMPPGLRSGNELQPLSLLEFGAFFAFLPTTLLLASVAAAVGRIRLSRENAEFWFLFVLCGALTMLSLMSPRATEYALPVAILLAGYCLGRFPHRLWFALAIATTLALQAYTANIYYRDAWSEPQLGNSGDFLAATSLLPAEARGAKVFNCEWVAGSYLLFSRPDVRFVDLLEPALLWEVSPSKYLARQRLIAGSSTDVHGELRRLFDADYVLCGSDALNSQMQQDVTHFEQIRALEPMGPLKVFRVKAS